MEYFAEEREASQLWFCYTECRPASCTVLSKLNRFWLLRQASTLCVLPRALY